MNPSATLIRVPALLFFCAVLHGYFLSLNIQILEIVSTVAFIAFTVSVFFIVAMGPIPSSRNLFIALTTAASPLGLLLGASFGSGAESFFWVADSVNTHVPEAIRVSNWLGDGGKFVYESSLGSQGILTHSWIGTFFFLFGASPATSVVGLVILKVFTTLIISRIPQWLFQREEMDGTFAVYLASPVVLFHTTAFYKEAMIHLLVAASLYTGLRVLRKADPLAACLLLLAIGGLFLERFYLGLLILVPTFFLVMNLFWRKAIVPALLLSIFFVSLYKGHPYFEFTVETAVATLKQFRDAHSKFADINYTLNYEIPYPLAVLKTLITPIWSPNKIDMFRGLSAVITWGSFIGQIIMLAYFMGLFRALRQKVILHALLQVPFFILVLAAAYISPWAARVRDSYFPLVAIYAGFYLIHCFRDDLRKIWLFKPWI